MGLVSTSAAKPPSGAAGGDLSGTYPNPAVANAPASAIPGFPGNGRKTLKGDGTWGLPAIITQTGTTLDVVNSAAETDLYSVTVSGGTLSTDSMVAMKILGDFLNNSGAAASLRLRFYLGATLLLDATKSTIAASSNRFSFLVDAWLAANGATNAQRLIVRTNGGSVVAATVGVGNMNAAGNWDATLIGIAGAEDSTNDLTFRMSVTLSAANANLSVRRYYGQLATV